MTSKRAAFLKIGGRVRHRSFGDGTITSLTLLATDDRIGVTFPEMGEKLFNSCDQGLQFFPPPPATIFATNADGTSLPNSVAEQWKLLRQIAGDTYAERLLEVVFVHGRTILEEILSVFQSERGSEDHAAHRQNRGTTWKKNP